MVIVNLVRSPDKVLSFFSHREGQGSCLVYVITLPIINDVDDEDCGIGHSL